MTVKRASLAVLFSLATAALAGAQSVPIPVGEEIDLRVDPEECGFVFPDLAFSGDGGLLVVWQDSARGLVARGFEPGGNGPGELSVLSATPLLWNNLSRVVGLRDDLFAVVWLDRDSSYEERTLLLQVFDRDGTPQSGVFKVATHVGGFDLAADGHDRMLVAWTQERDAVNDLMIQPFEALGPTSAPVAVESVSSDHTNGRYERVYSVRVAMSSRGLGLAIWDHGSYSWELPYGERLVAQWIDGAEVSVDGTSIGPKMSVSPADEVHKVFFRPQLVSPGRFLVAWLSEGQGIQTDMFRRTWSPSRGWTRIVKQEAADLPILMQIVGGPKIGATWIELANELKQTSLAIQSAGQTGEPVGPVVPISRPPCKTLAAGQDCGLYQWMINATTRTDGRIAVVWLVGRWTGLIPTDCDIGVTVRLRFLETFILQDDFETGDLAMWSSSKGSP